MTMPGFKAYGVTCTSKCFFSLKGLVRREGARERDKQLAMVGFHVGETNIELQLTNDSSAMIIFCLWLKK